MALEAHHRCANFVMPDGLRWHFDGLGMPKDKAPKALRAQLKKEAISFAVGAGSADILPAEQGGTRKFFRAARAQRPRDRHYPGPEHSRRSKKDQSRTQK